MNDSEFFPLQKSQMNLAAARLTASFGFFLVGIGVSLVLFVAAYPLGLVSAYPDPPAAAIAGPLGFERKIENLDALYRRPGEPMQGYLDRLTKTVAGGMTHYWTAGDIWAEDDVKYTKIGIFDNYLLWLQSFLPKYRDNLQNYEFATPQKALNRGYGFCSQVSKIVYSILADQGIEATIYSGPQHTIVESNGNVLDPDYGVFIPFPLISVETNPAIIDSYYANFGSMLPLLREAYSQSWQRLGSPQDFSDLRSYEEALERLKWFPPFVLLAMGVLFAVGGRLRQSRENLSYARSSRRLGGESYLYQSPNDPRPSSPDVLAAVRLRDADADGRPGSGQTFDGRSMTSRPNSR
jgi:hypothetical protein